MKEIITKVQEILGDNYEVEETKVAKTNRTLSGISIKECGGLASSIVYPEAFPTKDSEELARQIVKEFKNNPSLIGVDDKARDIFSNKVKFMDRVMPTLVSREKNTDNFKNGTVHMPFLDLEIMFRVTIEEGATVVVKKAHLDYLGITEDELKERAVINVAESVKIDDLINFLTKAYEVSAEDIKVDKDANLALISTSNYFMGAGTIVSKEVLKAVAERLRGDFYVLPSNIHEVIAVPYDTVDSVQTLKDMVTDINRTCVNECDYLSDTVYLFKDNELNIAV